MKVHPVGAELLHTDGQTRQCYELHFAICDSALNKRKYLVNQRSRNMKLLYFLCKVTFCILTSQLISNALISFSQNPLVIIIHELQTALLCYKLRPIHVSRTLISNVSLFTNVFWSVKFTSFTFWPALLQTNYFSPACFRQCHPPHYSRENSHFTHHPPASSLRATRVLYLRTPV